MTSNTITTIAIMVAIVAGTITTGTVAYAQQGETPNGNPFQALWIAIDDLQAQIDDITSNSNPGITLGDLECTTDQIARHDGENWVCSDEQTQFYTYRVVGNIVPAKVDSVSTASCRAGDEIVGGGFRVMNNGDVNIVYTGAVSQERYQTIATSDDLPLPTIRSHAICADLTP